MTQTDIATVAQLAARGIERVEVEFSGGNDEGGAEGIEFTQSDGETFEISPYASTYYPDSNEAKRAELGEPLIEAVQQPIYERYYSFAGDFYVNGRLIWDVPARKVYFEGDESQYLPIESPEVL